MNEPRIRYTALILNAIKFIYLLILILDFYKQELEYIGIQGSSIPKSFIIILIAFLAMGIMIILSIFFKRIFYVCTVIETLILLYIFIGSNSGDSAIQWIFTLLPPYILYYVTVIVIKSKAKKLQA